MIKLFQKYHADFILNTILLKYIKYNSLLINPKFAFFFKTLFWTLWVGLNLYTWTVNIDLKIFIEYLPGLANGIGQELLKLTCNDSGRYFHVERKKTCSVEIFIHFFWTGVRAGWTGNFEYRNNNYIVKRITMI